MTRPSRDLIAAALVGVGRPLVLARYGLDSCIVSTRISIAVFEHFGYLAEPCPVRVAIANPQLVAGIAAGVDINERATWPVGAWTVGLGLLADPAKGGHLVALSETVMVDLTLDQANRPEHRIALQPRAFRVTPEFAAGEAEMQFVVNGCAVAYRRVDEREWWKASPNWSRRDAVTRRAIAGAVIRAVRDSMARKHEALAE